MGISLTKGAFLDDIAAWKESGNVLPGLYGHRLDDPDYFVAGALDEGEDDHGWWLRNDAHSADIETGVYFQDGKPRRTQHIVLRGQARADSGAKLRWKLASAAPAG